MLRNMIGWGFQIKGAGDDRRGSSIITVHEVKAEKKLLSLKIFKFLPQKAIFF